MSQDVEFNDITCPVCENEISASQLDDPMVGDIVECKNCWSDLEIIEIDGEDLVVDEVVLKK